MVKKLKTTFDKWMADPEIKENFDKGYKDFVLSKLILALMGEWLQIYIGISKKLALH